MNKQETSADVLDLHGIKHADAKQITISFIEANWDMDKELSFITGNSGIMKGIVIKVIEEYGLPYKISELCYGKLIAWT